MKELQERIEARIARLGELPDLIRKEREKINGKAAIEELKTRLKGLWLDYWADAETKTKIGADDKKGGVKAVKTYPNEKARERYALERSQADDEYGQISEEIKRFEHQRNTASMNHEALVKEHSGLISTLDVLREMLVIAQSAYELKSKRDKRNIMERVWDAEREARKQVYEQEASNEKG